MVSSLEQKRKREYHPQREDPSATAMPAPGMRGECTRARRDHFKAARYYTLHGLGVNVDDKTVDCGSMPLMADGELDVDRICTELLRTDADAPSLYIAALRCVGSGGCCSWVAVVAQSDCPNQIQIVSESYPNQIRIVSEP